MPRYWTCKGCGTRHTRTRQRCDCGRRRPKASRPKHRAALDVPYEEYVRRFGERCGICGAEPSATRRLDRDHWHSGPRAGEPRGLLCSTCNRFLPNFADAAWLRNALAYLEAAS